MHPRIAPSAEALDPKAARRRAEAEWESPAASAAAVTRRSQRYRSRMSGPPDDILEVLAGLDYETALRSDVGA